MADNKKYYYLKLKEDFFDSDELKILEAMKDGYMYSNILLKLYLKSLRNEGRLMYKNVIPYTPEILATLTGHQVGTVEKALEVFQRLELVQILDNGAIYIMDIQNYIGKSSTEADRQRQYYNRVKEEKELIEKKTAEELPGTTEVEEEEAEPVVEEEPPKVQKPGNNYSNDFEEMWSIYPRKAEKAGAYKAWKARVKDGFSPAELLEAAKAYKAQTERERTEQRFIKHAKTFFGPATPFLDFISKEAPRAGSEVIDDDSNPFKR